jgi:hypothetical protein
MQNDIVVELAPLHNATGFDKERSLLEQLEQLEWEKNIGEYIRANTPQSFMSRDSEAMMQGIKVPAHLYYDASAHVSRERCKAVAEFFKLSARLLRQVQQIQTGEQAASARQAATEKPIELVKLICRRFHLVARQLTHRRQNRETLAITDEYDVQDLLHALLHINFEDIVEVDTILRRPTSPDGLSPQERTDRR